MLGYDYISTIEQDPWVSKFAGEKGQKLLIDIYKNPQSKIFPPFKHQDFIWNKKEIFNKNATFQNPHQSNYICKRSVLMFLNYLHK